jgi:hypothetical protein
MAGCHLEAMGRPRDSVDFRVQPARERPIAYARRPSCARPVGSWGNSGSITHTAMSLKPEGGLIDAGDPFGSRRSAYTSSGTVAERIGLRTAGRLILFLLWRQPYFEVENTS